MKSFKLYNGKRDKFSLRKKSVGLVSVAIATLAMYGIVGGSQTVQAEEQKSTNSQVTSVSASSEKTETEKAVVPTPISEDDSSVSSSSVSESEIMGAAQSVSGLQNSSTESTSSEDSSTSSSSSSSTEEESSKPSPTPSQSETTPKTEETNTAPQTRAARSRRSVTETISQISDFKVTVTTKDGTTMNSGDEKTLSNQEIAFEQIHMKFTLTQDGTLKAGTKIRIPVKLVNNAYGAYYSNLGSGTEESINGVGTIKFEHSDPNNLAYVITLNNQFEGQKIVEITQKAATIGKFTAKSSYENIVLEINGNTFTFKPQPRTFEKAQAPFAVYNSASSDKADSIKLGTSTGDANYYNNLLSSDGKNPGQTGIPQGDIISIYRIKPGNGSKIISIKPDPKRYTSTLAISEDGKYLVKGDTSTSISINSDPDNKLVDLPANSTNDTILKALKQAGKNSSVVIDNGDGTYTVAINLGKMIGEGATTYHEIWPTDDYAQMGDKYQEINRTEEVNKKVSAILKDASVIQGTGHSTRITFADSSIKNTITNESRSYSYNVDDNGNVTKLKEETISATTTPSNARAEGQKKITVHYIDTTGREIETQDYQFGFPAGGSAAQSPDYTANPKTIVGYSLVTADTQIGNYGTQLKGTQKIPFTNNDQDFYYVYAVNKYNAQVKYIDDTTGETLETKELTGDYSTTDSYRTKDTIESYEKKGYEFVSDNYPNTGVTYNETYQKFEVHLRHKVASVQETKTVTETIKYVYEDNTQAAATEVKTLDFERINTKDLVTNKIVYKGPWAPSTGTFPEVVSPAITGYTPDKTTVEATTVTADDDDINVTVTYKADKQKVTYTVIDDTTGTTLENQVDLTTGDSGANLPADAQTKYDTAVADYLAQGYELVSKDNLPAKFDTDSNVDQNVVVHLKHKVTTSSEIKTVKETIRYVYQNGSEARPSYSTSLSFTREVKTDEVTKLSTKGAWSPVTGTFAAVTSPMITGYTADKPIVAAVDGITGDSEDIVETVVYKANQERAQVRYIDDTTGATLETKELTGDYNTTDSYRTADTISHYTSQGYELVSDNYPTNGVIYNETYQKFEVHLKHGTAESQESKKVSLTVRYHGAGSQTPANNVQTATWTRTVTKDKVTGDVVKTTDWTADKASYDAVPSPVIPGYTVDVATVPAETVTQENMVKDVYYSIQTQKVTYTVIDDTTHTTLKDKVELTTGNSGANLPAAAQTKYDTAVADYLAQGYELVFKDNLPAQFDTDSNVDQNVVVHLKHKETISSENKTVTETIHYVYKDGSKAAESHKATLDFAREVRTDEVTKTTTKGAWTPVQDTFAEVVSPTIAGYTADKPVVEAISGVTGDSKDVVVKVTYTADKQRVTYTVIDDTTGTTLENQVELTTGESDTSLPATAKTKYDQVVAAYKAQGYELVSKDELPAKFDTDSKIDQNVVIRLKHGTAESQESKKVSLTVRYHGAGSQTPANNVQTATWTRTVTKDKITGLEVSATSWVSDKANYNAVPSPVIPGYTVDVATVPAETVTQEDMVKDVHYSIQTQKVTYTVIDDTTGTTLENQVELTTGESDSALPAAAKTKYDQVVKGYTDKGYELVSKDELPVKFDTDSNVDQNVVVHLKHKVTTSSEIKTVKETIRYVYQNGSEAKPSYSTSLSFTREVKTDEVTKLSTKGAWSPVTGTFAAVTSPMITGYTADKPIVAAVDGITGDSEDIVETVVYKANQERAQVRYIDDTTGATLETKELTGDYNTTDSYRTAGTISHYTSQGYELVSDNYPTNGVIYNETYQKFEVHLKHGTAESQESKKVSLTVRYHGAGSQTPANNVQTATWTRTVTKDKVTGDVVKATDWTADKASYDAVPSPVIPGYTVDVATVPAETVTQEDMVKDVYYTVIPVTPDNPTPPVVPSTPDKPTTPTVVPTTPTKATPTKTEILPSTGDSQVGSTLATLTGVSLLLSAFGYIGRRKKED